LVVQPDGDLFTISNDHYIFYSSDNGDHWISVTQPVDPVTNEHYLTIQTDPFGNLYAFYNGLAHSYKSADKGQSWLPIHYSPFGFAFGNDFLFAPNGDIYFLQDGFAPQLYLAAQDTSIAELITTTNGQYLYPISPVVTAQGELLFIDQYSPLSRLYRFVSGQNAEPVAFPGSQPMAITAAPNGLTFVISHDSLFQTENSGSQWTYMGKTPSNEYLLDFVVGNDQHLYLSYDQHTPFRSTLPITSSSLAPLLKSSVLAFPNPWHDLLHIRVSDAPAFAEHTLVMTDALGSVVGTVRFSGSDLELPRHNLPPAMYFYAILNEHGQWIAVGRVMAD